MLIEIHILQNHSPSNLNRDDTGSPKECVFGGVKRARISSQCLKRTIRRSDIFQTAMSGHLGTRTRRLPELVHSELLTLGLSSELAAVAAKKASGFGTKEGKENEKLETAQTMFLTKADISAIAKTLYAAAMDAGIPAKLEKITAKELQAAAKQTGYRPIDVDVALFGRMTTSEALRDVEASAQVAHALSTHKVDHEFDYYTAVDDLQGGSEEEEDAGADMIGDIEYNSACYYKYIAVDFQGLVDNLTGAKSASRSEVPPAESQAAIELAASAIQALLRAALLTTPTGKQNSFAAHQLPNTVLIEVRPHKTPVSYANAFVDPARRVGTCDLLASSRDKLKNHVKALTDGFNLSSSARLLLCPESPDFVIDGVERVASLNLLCSRLGEVVSNG